MTTNKAIDTGRIGSYQWSVHYDETPSSPREWDNATTIYGWRRDFDLGDEQLRTWHEDYAWSDDALAAFFADEQREVLYLAELMYADYGSGCRLTLGRKFDVTKLLGVTLDQNASGLVVIYDTDAKLVGTSPEYFDRVAEEDVQVYEDYLNGNVYGYVVERIETCNLGHEHTTHVDSCWGYFGYDDCVKEARAIAQDYANDDAKVPVTS